MAKTDFKTPDEYIATFAEPVQRVLRQVQAAIRKGAPRADEVISYQVPAFRSDGGWVFYYSTHAKHYSLACPPGGTFLETFADDLARYRRSKSAIQFPLDEPVPTKLITAMAKHRAREHADAAKARAAAKPAAKKPASKASKKR